MRLSKDKSAIHISRSGDVVDITVTIIDSYSTAVISASVRLADLLDDFNIELLPRPTTAPASDEPPIGRT